MGRIPSNYTHPAFLTDRYEAIEMIGQGGMGSVYRAFDTALGINVVIKTVLEVDDYEKCAVRFQQEAKLLSRLNHDNLVKVYDFGSSESGSLYMVLEYIEGTSLKELLEKDGPLPLSRAVAIMTRICQGLARAHEEKIVHRDLKPANIIVYDRKDPEPIQDEVKIIDFGIAHAMDPEKSQAVLGTGGNTMAGSPLYMAPEVIHGESGTSVADIYALGCIFFELLTGRVPFQADTMVETFTLHSEAEVPSVQEFCRYELPDADAVQSLIERALTKDKSQRYQSVEEFLKDLKRIPLQHPSLKTGAFGEFKPPSNSEHPLTRIWNRYGIIIVATVLTGSLLTAALLGMVYMLTGPKAEPPSERVLEKKKVEQTPLATLVPDLVDEGVDTGGRPFKRGSKHGFGECWIGGPFIAKDEDIKLLAGEQPLNLSFKQCEINGTGLEHLPEWPLNGISFEGSALTDEGLKRVSRFKTITKLDLTGTGITDRGLVALEKLPRLEHLEIIMCPHISIDGVGRLLKNCSSLRTLKMNQTNIDRSVVPKVVSSKLTTVELGGNWIRDQDIEKLSKMHSLENLGLFSSEKLTDKSIDYIASMENLKRLDITLCKGISSRARASLQKKRPDLRIEDRINSSEIKERTQILKDYLR
ncbi:protein kinase [bacterium]|nr:protein kinase [bacterium]